MEIIGLYCRLLNNGSYINRIARINSFISREINAPWPHYYSLTVVNVCMYIRLASAFIDLC